VDEMTELRRMRAAVPLLEPDELGSSWQLPWKQEATESIGSAPRRSGRSRRSSGRRFWTAVIILVAAAGAAVGAVLLGSASTVGQAPPSGGVATLSARTVLLTAARQVEHQPSATAGHGWWREHFIDADAWVVGPAGDRYVVEQRFDQRIWQRRTQSGGYRQVSILRSLGARPQTAADVAAWRRDGSPTHWLLIDSNSQGGPRVLQMRPSRAEVTRSSIPCLRLAGERVPRHGTCVVFKSALRLPTDPASLAKVLAGELAGDPEGASGALLLLAGSQFFLGGGPLAGRQFTPAMRAALYRELADLPGIRSLGIVRDPIGRSGLAVATAARPETGPGRIERRLIIDPGSGRLLAELDIALTAANHGRWARPGNPVSWEVFLTSGWAPAGDHPSI
jgi:hypothetical protein